MKSLLFSILTFSTIAASAMQEVTYDQNDALPADHLRYGVEIRTKLFPHTNGQNYVIMYHAQQNAGQPASTKIVGICNIGYKDSIERCSQDNDPVLMDVYKAVVQKNKPDCSKIALLNQDHLTTLNRISEYNSTNSYRDHESNARALLPITSSLAFQVETLNTFVPSMNYAENVRSTKQLIDDVSNRRLTPYESMIQLVRKTSAIKRDFATLLSASRCTNEDLQMCRFNKQTGEILTPEVNMDHYNKYIEVERKGLIEMRACSTATAAQPAVVAPPAEPAAPAIEPMITNPAIEAQPLDPSVLQ